MTLTVPNVISWRPDALAGTANGVEELSRKIDETMHSLCSEQDDLAETWHGDAAEAAAERVMGETRTASTVANSLNSVAEGYRAAAKGISGVQSELIQAVDAATNSGYTVNADGTVDASAILARFPAEIPVDASVARAQLDVMKVASEMTEAVVVALRQCDRVAKEAVDRIRAAASEVEASAQAVSTGMTESDGQGGFSWKPDVPATAASSVVGFMTDVTGSGLERTAIASADDIARGIAKGLGPFGAAVGVVPAIFNDIDSGMSPVEAVVSEGAGAGVGYVVGSAASTLAAYSSIGATVGSVVPGGGTIVGGVAGVVAGGVVAFVLPKLIQSLW